MNPTDQAAPVPKPKRWPIALLVAFITGIAGAAGIAPIADWVMELHHVSAMEGGRAYAVVCLWIPLAFVIGCIVGFVVSLQIKRPGFVGYLIKQGLALVVAGGLVLAVAGIGDATVDHPPLLNGKNLALEIEVQVPAKGRTIEELKKADFDVALVATVSDRSYADMRWIDAVKSNEFIFVTAWVNLNSREASRQITAGVANENRQIFNVMLPPSPKKVEDEWSEWMPPSERFDHSKPAPNDQYLVRYRVRFADEYLPTPRPEYEPASPAPEATPEPSATP